MGLFTLEGFAEPLTPIAEKLGLLPAEVTPVDRFGNRRTWSGAATERRWQKTFPSRKRGRKTPGASPVSAPHMRPCSDRGNMSNAMSKAVDYALWLATRDGKPIARKAEGWSLYDGRKWDVSAPGKAVVKFRTFKRFDGSTVTQAESVFFGGLDRLIAIPHCGYDATLPALEERDAPNPVDCDFFACLGV